MIHATTTFRACWVGCVLGGMLLLNSSKAADDEPTAPIGAGRYSLRIHTDAFPEEKRDVSIPIVITEPKMTEPKNVDKFWLFEWQTDKGWDNPFSGEGTCFRSEIKLGFTGPERETIITYHYLGKVGDDGIARGKFTCFVDGAKAFDGTWRLTKREIKVDEPERNGDAD